MILTLPDAITGDEILTLERCLRTALFAPGHVGFAIEPNGRSDNFHFVARDFEGGGGGGGAERIVSIAKSALGHSDDLAIGDGHRREEIPRCRCVSRLTILAP